MRHSPTRSLLLVLAVFATGNLAQATDLPGFGAGLKSRVMIQFDNSRSMLLAPDPLSDALGDLTYAADDYDPDNNPGGSCKNKLCLGKRVISNLLPNYESLVDMGLATYYQFQRVNVIPTGGGETWCQYDVLAAPGETRSFLSYTDLGATTPCVPNSCVNPAPYDQYTCTQTGTSWDVVQWFDPSHGSDVGVSSYVYNGRTWQLSWTELQPPGPPWNWFLVAKNPTCPTPTTPGATYTETNRGDWGCTGSNPCQMFYEDQVVTGTTLSLTTYRDMGPSYNSSGTTYSQAGTSVESWDVGSPPCNQPTYVETNSSNVPGCSSGTPCDMTYLRTDTSSGTDTQSFYQDHGATTTINSIVYAQSGSMVQAPFEIQLTVANPTCRTSGYTDTTHWDCSPSKPCDMTYTGTRVVPGEITQQFCQYQRTQYLYSATFSSSACVYQRTVYNYVAPGPDQTWCEYSRYVYDFTSPVFTYQYQTYGGEIVDSTWVEVDLYNDWCGTPYASGLGPNKVCPPTIDNSGQPCWPGRHCPLVWRSPISAGADAGLTFPSGRNSYYVGSSPGTPSGCMAVDAPDAGIAQPDPGGYYRDWCWALGTVPGVRLDVRQVTDYYDPSTANPADGGFPMARKYSGWSRAEDGTQNPSLVFIDIDGGTLDPILQAMKKYYPIDAPKPNPLGIRTSNNDVFQDYTPLYGAAKNAHDYFANLIANDPDAACRNYYYLIVTDGQEYTPMNYSDTDLERVIDSMRRIPVAGLGTKDVKTYVVGFGSLAQGGALDLMARAGGTAIDPVTLRTDLVNGTALNAVDELALADSLNLVFSYLAAGTFTRSKPLLAVDGSRIYAPYFRRLPSTQEWPGGLAAFNVDINGVISSQLWDYGQQINTQPTRTIYTHVPSNPSLVYFDTTASGANANPTDQASIYSQMGVAQVDGDEVITFLRDMSLSELFVDGSRKTSRASDIYHSNPAVVGAANHSSVWGGSNPSQQALYDAYKATTTSREITLYIGANDGMLHAIREDANPSPASWAGTERWAYVPPAVLGQLPNNRVAHTFTVDGSFGIEDVCFGSCASASDWKTVLVGALREGGPALYSLDVTDPNSPKYLWTFYDGNLGNTFSPPVIARLRVNLTGTPVDRWVAFVGGGVSTTVNRGNYFYIIDATTGAILQDSVGTQAIYQVDLLGGLPKNNIPPRVTVYRPLDASYASTVYFGDTQGRLNRVDLTSGSLATMRPQRFFDPADANCQADIFGNSNTPILRASDGVQVGSLPFPNPSDPQPIYPNAVLAKDRTGRKMLFLGTGDSTNPTTTTDLNYFYAIRDPDTGGSCSGVPAWVKVFDPGEKVIADPVIAGNALILSTFLPPPPGAACSNSGSANIFGFDMITGRPASVLNDGRGNMVSKIQITGQGIVSDLAISGKNLVFNTSNNPTSVQTVGLNLNASVSVRSWQRVR